MERIGFIGLGLMGGYMASNILAAGYPLKAFDPKAVAVDALVTKGAEGGENAAELGRDCSIVFLCVPTSEHVEQVIDGDNGLRAGAKAAGNALIIVDCSTSQPTVTRRLAESLADDGITLVDAALGGTPTQAESGQLQAIVGSDDETLARLRPVLETWAGKILHCGGVGTGHTMKLLNQFLAMSYGAVFSEALTIGAKAGISPQVFDSVIRGSRMDSGFYQTFFQYVLERDRNAHRFTLANAGKDIRYVAALADALEVKADVAHAVSDLYASALAQGDGDKFVPELSDIVASRHQLSLF
ncbi:MULTISPECIES: NAD(P)-dependent oxidoreductase [unclassified Halomonas]|uniref:NAD(P)-dependent oxidoreductase n=1 Tax=unclassified Halomonas TaxID=2609666 RepID=UPI0020A0FECA|nr:MULTISPECIES: NAD(P)-dependent oxidoreductase [unclassified Halomonas]MCP1316084.1 NAD(P)-dependent oxidoreductase [Halomonas sp. 707D7]MCP1328508.1 NAD(P)-dependent oxidoreductase [Halomonas sp. 707D4]